MSSFEGPSFTIGGQDNMEIQDSSDAKGRLESIFKLIITGLYYFDLFCVWVMGWYDYFYQYPQILVGVLVFILSVILLRWLLKRNTSAQYARQILNKHLD